MTNPDLPPPRGPPGGLLEGIVDRVLSYASTPWKAVTIVVLILLAGIGLVAYEKREIIIEAWLTPSETELKTAEVPAALEKLVGEIDADLVQVWAVDLATNSQTFIAARRRDGQRPVIPSPRRLPIIVTVSDVRALERVLEGNPICLDVTEFGSPLARRLAERGMKRGCAVPIPPSAQHFIGVIYLAWITPVDEASEKLAIGAARQISATLITR